MRNKFLSALREYQHATPECDCLSVGVENCPAHKQDTFIHYQSKRLDEPDAVR